MNTASLAAFCSSKEFIDPTNPDSMQRVSEVSHELSILMQQVASVKSEIAVVDRKCDGLLEVLNKELHLSLTALDVIRKKQELKDKYAELSKLQSDRDKLQKDLMEASILYCTAKAKLDLINEHAFKSKVEVSGDATTDTGGAI